MQRILRNARALGLAWLCLVSAACEDAPSASPPDAGNADVASDTEGSDAAGNDAKADSLAGQTDAATADAGCAEPCDDDDGNPCTFAVCEQGSCVAKVLADGSSCEDGNPCTTADTCQSGVCKASTAAGSNVCGCTTNADCAALDDGLQCNGQLFCDKGAFPYTCKVNPATLPPCESQPPPSPCLVPACAEPGQAGAKPQCTWQPKADGTACDDSNPLTEGDTCVQGVCAAGQFVGTCQNNTDCAAFEDGNLCNGQLFCNKSKGKCQLNPATVVSCPTGQDTTCSKNTCSPTTGKCSQQAQANNLACDDGNDCTSGEVCQQGTCTGATNTCSCTADADCAGQEDGNLCNGTLYCNLAVGKCQVNPATVVSCGASGNACELLACQPATGACVAQAMPNGTPCNADNTLCTLADACQAGQCQAGENLCKCAKTADCALFDDGDQCNGQLFCNLQGGVCEVNPSSVVTCDPELETACSQQVCVPLSGECTAAAYNEGGGCDDGDVCTLGDTCSQGTCTAGSAACVCATDADCAGQEDGNLCNGTLYCDSQSGTCKVNPATIVSCVDSLPGDCTSVACVPETGLCAESQAVVGASCDDGNPCTAGEICGQNGTCAGGAASCGCATDLDCATFDDGNPCNGKVICDLTALPYATCTLTPAVVCDAEPCQLAACATETGLCESVTATEGSACDDGDPCTGPDVCARSGCFGLGKDCDDGNECTADLCAAGTCKHEPVANSLPCEADLCSVSAACAAGVCAQTPKNCDDGDDCTLDSCDGKSGACLHNASGEPCDDGDLCTADDTCKPEGCSGMAITCLEPPSVCQQAVCQPQSGCVVVDVQAGAPCDDGDVCTLTDSCAGGACVGSGLKVCDDGDPCTSDPGCSKALTTTGGCSAGLPDNNPMTYWASTTPDQSGQGGVVRFAYNALADTWAAVGQGQGEDPYVRLWAGSNAFATDATVPYPGRNQPLSLAADGSTGWLIGGVSGPQGNWVEENGQALLARLDAAGQVQWLSTTFVGNGAVADIVPIEEMSASGKAQVVLAGTRNAHLSEVDAQMWLAKVEVGDDGPKVVGSGHCSAQGSSMGLYGERAVQLSTGDWLLAGYGKFDNGEWLEKLPVWCRFDSQFKLIHGPVFSYDSDAGLEMQVADLDARPDGGFWLLLDGDYLSIWRAYDAAGELVADSELPNNTRHALPAGDGVYLGRGDDGGAYISLDVLGMAIQSDTTLHTRFNTSLIGMTRDPRGIALLFSDWNGGTTIVHTDPELVSTCSTAQSCEAACADGDLCSIDFCSLDTAVCVHEPAVCDDENPCTFESCGDKGCVFTPISDQPCDDGQTCTTDDQCVAGRCKGTSRFGVSAVQVALGEELVDGVVHGDGLLVLGQKLVDGKAQVFWRKYGPNRDVMGEGTIVTGTPIALARSVAALQGQGVFESGEPVGFVYRTDDATERLGFVQPDAQFTELLTQPLDGPEPGVVAGGLMQSGGQLWAVRTAGAGAGEVWVATSGGAPSLLTKLVLTDSALLGVRPQGEGWLVAWLREPNGPALVVQGFDGGFGSQTSPQSYGISGEPADGPLCRFGAATRGGTMLLCGQLDAFWAQNLGGEVVVTTMTDLTLTEAALRARHAPLDNERVAALRPESTDGEWRLLLHDGVFNQGSSSSLAFDASTVPVFATSDLDIWLVAETVGGQIRTTTVYHLDKYANQSCAMGGNCYQKSCEDDDVCTFATCSYGLCGTPSISAWGNCGTNGQCSQGQCGGAGL